MSRLTKDDIHNMLAVASFIGWHDPNHMMGGYTAEFAFKSLCKMMQVPEDKMMEIVKGPNDDSVESRRV